ncbi:MAG: MaoC family dehydratase [Gammaproteobacteria bacterium AqS3]|nr:MaoC family dehydratase [Gammaproteobacteria bacterium AqS3]
MSKAAEVQGRRFFEDYAVGDVYKHFRGKTVKESDAVTICNMVLNSASGHFNDDVMSGTAIGESIVYGGVTISMVIGLAAQDTAENAIRELAMDNIKLLAPVKHGDTLYAYSEVLDAAEHDEGGVVTFRHYGVNQHDKLVFQGERTVLIKKRPG